MSFGIEERIELGTSLITVLEGKSLGATIMAGIEFGAIIGTSVLVKYTRIKQ